jgi:hypothetical protein
VQVSTLFCSLALRVITVCLLFAGPTTTLACTCKGMSVSEALRSANVVFVGKVEAVTAVDPLTDWEPRVIVRFRVARVWKGPVPEIFEMHTNFEASSCSGFPRSFLQENETLLVYGAGHPASSWKANGIHGASNALSWTARRDKSKPLRQDLVDALPDDQIVYSTSICTRTMPAEQAVEDFEKLGGAK